MGAFLIHKEDILSINGEAFARSLLLLCWRELHSKSIARCGDGSCSSSSSTNSSSGSGTFTLSYHTIRPMLTLPHHLSTLGRSTRPTRFMQVSSCSSRRWTSREKTKPANSLLPTQSRAHSQCSQGRSALRRSRTNPLCDLPWVTQLLWIFSADFDLFCACSLLDC
jgi:hypothetical protein